MNSNPQEESIDNSQGDIPLIFQARKLRGPTKYRNLREHFFDHPEVMWLCEEMDRKHSPRPDQVISPAAISKRYDISELGLKEWLNMSKYGTLEHTMLHKCIPPPLDGYSVRKLMKMMKDSNNTNQDLADFCNMEMEKTTKRRNKRKRKYPGVRVFT